MSPASSLQDGPRANIEVKARLRDLDAAIRTAQSLGARDSGADRQVDTYFRVPHGRLKLRESLFVGEQLILYVRPDVAAPRRADYEVLPAPRGGRTRELLQAMLGVEVVVEKVRQLYVLGDTRIHLDTVQNLGEFIEFEAVYPYGLTSAEAAALLDVKRLMEAFHLSLLDVVPHSYRELLLSTGT